MVPAPDSVGAPNYGAGAGTLHAEPAADPSVASGDAAAACPVSRRAFGGYDRSETAREDGEGAPAVSLDPDPRAACGHCAVVDTGWEHPDNYRGVALGHG